MDQHDLPTLPLPGQQPTHIYQPPTTRYPIPWRFDGAWRMVRAGIMVIGLVAAGWIWVATRTPVTVVVNGAPVAVHTHRSRVMGAVRAAGVRLNDAIHVIPPLDSRLEPGLVITVAELRPVIAHVDGVTRILSTRQADPTAALAEAGIVLGPGDSVEINRAMRPSLPEIARDPALASIPLIPREITVRRARPVVVIENPPTGSPTEVSLLTGVPTVGQALSEAGYVLYEGDRIEPGWFQEIGTPPDGTLFTIRIERATPVTVLADGRIIPARTRAAQVGILLSELGLALTGVDYVIPAADTPLAPDMLVRLVRVHTEKIIEETTVEFGTTYIPDPTMELDEQRIVEEGQAGSTAEQIAVRYEDGKEVSRISEGRWVVHHPRDRIIAYGTRIVIRTAELPGGPIEYWRKLRVLATSYSPLTAGSKKPGDPFFGLSATGTPVVRGIVATDPRVIGLGTRLFVPGYGYGQALDVGGAVKGFRIDLGYDDANLVLWNDWVDIYLIPPAPPPDQMIWVLPD